MIKLTFIPIFIVAFIAVYIKNQIFFLKKKIEKKDEYYWKVYDKYYQIDKNFAERKKIILKSFYMKN